MRGSWRLDENPKRSARQFTIEHVLELKTEHVLVWFDEPQVITALDQNSNRYLGVAADDSDDGEFVRWIYAPITHLEYQALVGGGTTVREALAKDRLIVADRRVDGGAVEVMWQVTNDDIPDELRPSEDSWSRQRGR